VEGTCGRGELTRRGGGARWRRDRAGTETLSWRGGVKQRGTPGEAFEAPCHLHSSIDPTSHRRLNAGGSGGSAWPHPPRSGWRTGRPTRSGGTRTRSCRCLGPVARRPVAAAAERRPAMPAIAAADRALRRRVCAAAPRVGVWRRLGARRGGHPLLAARPQRFKHLGGWRLATRPGWSCRRCCLLRFSSGGCGCGGRRRRLCGGAVG